MTEDGSFDAAIECGTSEQACESAGQEGRGPGTHRQVGSLTALGSR